MSSSVRCNCCCVPLSGLLLFGWPLITVRLSDTMSPTFVGQLTSTCEHYVTSEGHLLKNWLRHWPLPSSIHTSTILTLLFIAPPSSELSCRVVLRDNWHHSAGDLYELHWLPPYSVQIILLHDSWPHLQYTVQCPPVSLCLCEPCSIITHLIKLFAKSTNASVHTATHESSDSSSGDSENYWKAKITDKLLKIETTQLSWIPKCVRTLHIYIQYILCI